MMRRVTTLALIALFGAFGVQAMARNTALEAARILPPEVQRKVARIAGVEGMPQPERWHVIVHDPTAENGFKDYVIANGEMASRNSVSQFVGEVRADDVIGHEIRVDSDRAAIVAQEFAAANNVSVASLNFEMRKDALGADPVWKVTCIDGDNVPVGWIVINANEQTVIARGGFPKVPRLPASTMGEPLLEPVAEGGFHAPPSSVSESDAPRAAAKPASKRTSSSRSRSKSRRAETRRADPVNAARIVTKPVRIIRGIIDF